MSDFDDFLNEEIEDDGLSEDLSLFTVENRTLLIDGDIILYRPCCIFNEDTDDARRLTIKNIENQINKLMDASEASDYILFLTTKKNFRNYITDDYKANRKDIERPVNLGYTKNYLVDNLGAVAVPYLEADDLLHIHTTEDTVIWSLDKDLRQIAGKHLDDATMEVVEVTELGEVIDAKHFNGYLGLMYQSLVGDTADYIIGCAERLPHVYKSGAKKGQKYLKRKGVTPKVAIQALKGVQSKEEALKIVCGFYKDTFGNDWIFKLETQMNLLVMVSEYDDDARTIPLWTVNADVRRLNLLTGEAYDG